MKETTKTLSRRALVAGVTVAAAAPALAAAPLLSGRTAIGQLWTEAEALRVSLDAHRAEIAQVATRAGDGVPGWMRLAGEANRIGEARYGKLVAILNAKPEKASDLAIIAKVSQDVDLLAGARGWAAERLASASLALAA
jgi:hypothetical protein